MYSIVMLAAMTASPEPTDFFCKGKAKYSSSQGCYGGCYGAGAGAGSSDAVYAYAAPGYGYAAPAYAYAPPGYGYSAPAAYGVVVAAPAAGVRIQERAIIEKGPPAKVKDPQQTQAVPADKAQVVINLPADAKLIAEGQPTSGNGAERSFLTPALPAGKDFHYTFTIEYAEGTTIKTSTAKLTVRAGHRSELDFNVKPEGTSTVSATK